MSLIEYNGESKVIKRICELLDTMTGISFVVVQTLPTVDIQTNVIYLVPKQTAEVDNIYDEYINTDGTSQGWELIGTTEIDLTNYVQFSDLSTVATSGDYDDLIDKPVIPTDFVPKSTGGVFEGNVEIVRSNSGTSNVNSVLRLGNDKADGVTGNTRGVIQVFDRNGNYTNVFASDNASSGNIYLPKDKPNNSILATTDDAEKVKQEYTQNTSGEYLLIASNSDKDSTSDETEKVKKVAHFSINGSTGMVKLCRKHSGTSVFNHALEIGNAIPDGTAGAVDGVSRNYGKGEYYFQFYDGYNSLSNNQTYRPRNRTGVLGLLPDATENAALAQMDDMNLLNPPYYHVVGNYGNLYYSSNEDTGDYTVSGSDSSNRALNLKRYSQGLYLTPGTYRISGCPSGGSSSTYSIRVYSSTEAGATTGIGNDYGSGLEFSLAEKTLIHIVFYVNANASINATFRPTLKKISKVDWRSNGFLGAKNLNSYPYNESSHTDSGVVFTDLADGTVKAEGKSIASTRSGFVCHSRVASNNYPLFLPNGNYILSGCPSGGSEESFYIEIGRTLNGGLTRYGRETGSGLAFTVNGDDNNTDGAYIQIVCYCLKDYQIPSAGIIFKPMLRVAADTDEMWQPYTMTNQKLTEIMNSVPTAAGTYNLQAVRNSNGSITYSWV